MNRPFPVRLMLSNNSYGSVTRLTADTANVLTRLGVPVTVSYPAVEWWDYKLFALRRAQPATKIKQGVRLAADWLAGVPIRKDWCGGRFHSLDPSVRTERFGVSPSAMRWSPEEMTVVHPPYLIPHLLRTIPNSGIRMVSALHINLEKAMNSPSAEAAAWFSHWVARERMISIPRYTTSEQARAAAERLGIPIRRVIPDGVNLSLFRPALGKASDRPLTVTLYCVRHAQKGQAVGLEALRRVRGLSPSVRLCSIGELLPEAEGVFDHSYGYLQGEAYAQALRESDLFIYPSLYDGFPAPPLQAIASGAALITTAVEGVSDYAVNERNCLLVQPGDSEGMAQAVLRLVRDPVLRKEIVLQGIQTAIRYEVEQTTRQLLDFLREVREESPLQREEFLLAS